jgi:hypothetical protein
VIIALMSGACGIMIMIMLTDVIDEFCRGRSYLRGDIHLRPSTIFYQQLTHDWLGMWLILGWRMEVILLPLRRISHATYRCIENVVAISSPVPVGGSDQQ